MSKHPRITVEIAKERFSQMLRDLADIDPAVDFRRLVMSEAGRTIANSPSSALARTVAAKVGAIRKRHADATHTKFMGKVYNLKWRYPDKLWSDLQKYRAERLKVKLAARGLAKQSWMHAAIKLGTPFDAPDYVMFANFRGRTYPQDVDVSTSGSGRSFTVTVTNNSPLVPHAQMPRALMLAMWGRAQYFERNMASGVFRTLANRAKAYPGIYHSPVPAPADNIEI